MSINRTVTVEYMRGQFYVERLNNRVGRAGTVDDAMQLIYADDATYAARKRADVITQVTWRGLPRYHVTDKPKPARTPRKKAAKPR